jgi:hypothetical protein
MSELELRYLLSGVVFFIFSRKMIEGDLCLALYGLRRAPLREMIFENEL